MIFQWYFILVAAQDKTWVFHTCALLHDQGLDVEPQFGQIDERGVERAHLVKLGDMNLGRLWCAGTRGG